jgi:hypothetical protein
MIRIERGRMPAGAQAVALRQDGRIVVYVSEGLSGRERLAAVREALRAAPAAGWRPPRSPVLVPALALSAGLRQVPEGRWCYRVAVAGVAGAALLITATSLATVSVEHGGVHQPAAAGPGRPPLTGAGPATSQSATTKGRIPGGSPGTAPRPRSQERPRSRGRRPRPAAARRPRRPRRRGRPPRWRLRSRPRARLPSRPRPHRRARRQARPSSPAARAPASTCSASLSVSSPAACSPGGR